MKRYILLKVGILLLIFSLKGVGQDTIGPVSFGKLQPRWTMMLRDSGLVDVYDTIALQPNNGFKFVLEPQIHQDSKGFLYLMSGWNGTIGVRRIMVQKVDPKDGRIVAYNTLPVLKDSNGNALGYGMDFELTDGESRVEVYVLTDNTPGDGRLDSGRFGVMVFDAEDLSLIRNSVRTQPDSSLAELFYLRGANGYIVINNKRLIHKLDSGRYEIIQAVHDVETPEEGSYGLQRIVVSEDGQLLEHKEKLFKDRGGLPVFHYFNPMEMGNDDTLCHPVFYGQFDPDRRSFVFDYYDRSLNFIKRIDLTDKIPKDILPGGIAYYDNRRVVFKGYPSSNWVPLNNNYNYAFNFDGTPLYSYQVNPIQVEEGASFAMEDGILFLTTKKPFDDWDLKFFKPDNQRMYIFRDEPFSPAGRLILPRSFKELSNGDILLSVSLADTTGNSLIKETYATAIMYFDRATLLDLISANKDIVQDDMLGSYTLSPNPAHRITRIHFSEPFDGRVNVFDVLGKNIMTIPVLKSDAVYLELYGLMPGIYMVVPVGNSSYGKVYRGKMLKVE